MGGFDLRTIPDTGVHDPVFASALVLDDGKRACVICSVETVGVPENLVKDIRRAVCKRLPISEDAMQISAIHTHAAPEAFFEAAPCYDEEYYIFLVREISESIIRAYNKLHEVKVFISSAAVGGVGSYRDRVREESEYNMPTATLLFKSLDQCANDIVLSAFSCHPTVLNEANTLVSSDLVYGFRKYFENACPNVDLILINGSCADVSTRYTRTAASYDEVERLGALWANGVIGALDGEEITDATISAVRREMFIPSANFFDEDQKREVLEHLDRKIAECKDSQQRREYVSCRSVLVRSNYGTKGGCNAELGAIRIGNAVIFSMPFEYAASDADVLRERIDKKFGCKSIACCYANGYEGYLPSGRPLDKDSGYEDIASYFRHDAKWLVADEIEALFSSIKFD
jgi:hypothetical protein